jgi:hypothetical protein
VAKPIDASAIAAKLLVGVLVGVVGLAVMLAANAAAAAAKKQKPAAPQMANSGALCRGANLFYCGPIYNSNDYLGTDPDPFIRSMIQRDLGTKYGGPD